MESALGLKYDLILVLRSQIFESLRETFYRHALEFLQRARSDSYGILRLAIIDLFEGLWSVGTCFAASASPWC